MLRHVSTVQTVSSPAKSSACELISAVTATHPAPAAAAAAAAAAAVASCGELRTCIGFAAWLGEVAVAEWVAHARRAIGIKVVIAIAKKALESIRNSTWPNVSMFERLVLEDGLEQQEIRFWLPLKSSKMFPWLWSRSGLWLRIKAQFVPLVTVVSEMREIRAVLSSTLHI